MVYFDRGRENSSPTGSEARSQYERVRAKARTGC